MAIIQANIMSSSLARTVPIQVILPVDKLPLGSQEQTQSGKFKTMYLLHGLFGNYTDWVRNSNISRYAEAKDLAVVMPSGDNSFYVDGMLPNSRYGNFIGRELVEVTRKMFPLSEKREDTFIAGFSMGGFGAIRNGFCYADTFGYIAGLSSALNIFELPLGMPGRCLMNEDAVFGDIPAASVTDKNPRVAVAHLKAAMGNDATLALPQVYMSVGSEDALIEPNRRFRDFLLSEGIEPTYEEAPGKHNWDFWDSQIKKVLDWLPLEDRPTGLNSGNVAGDPS